MIKLKDGSVMTRADLPPAETRRWVASRKALVVRALSCGLLSRAEAFDMYGLTPEEIDSWIAAVDAHGEQALFATRLKNYRQV